uniref:CCAAT/enhancer-binding protein delta-like n=1 Tax=Petromyzon marinus TaxID=7757 RepID=A0AAJ7UEK0_PETMA|nr:CCAAT/enhancer-binding protein delta-like [Petromyzon marinus]
MHPNVHHHHLLLLKHHPHHSQLHHHHHHEGTHPQPPQPSRSSPPEHHHHHQQQPQPQPHHQHHQGRRRPLKKALDKSTDDYRARRERNNVAVRKSRDKAKLRSAETAARVVELAADNERLRARTQRLALELGALRALLGRLPHVTLPGASSGGGGGEETRTCSV